MLLQISNKDSLDSLLTLTSPNISTGLFLLIGLIAVGLFFYLFSKYRKKEKVDIFQEKETKHFQTNDLTVDKDKNIVITAKPNPKEKIEEVQPKTLSTVKETKVSAPKPIETPCIIR